MITINLSETGCIQQQKTHEGTMILDYVTVILNIRNIVTKTAITLKIAPVLQKQITLLSHHG